MANNLDYYYARDPQLAAQLDRAMTAGDMDTVTRILERFQRGDVMTPGVPGGPIDMPPPVRNPSPSPSWQINQGGFGGIVQLLTLGTVATQLLRWLGGK